MTEMNSFTKQKQTHRHIKQTMVTKGENRSLGLADTNYDIENKQVRTV